MTEPRVPDQAGPIGSTDFRSLVASAIAGAGWSVFERVGAQGLKLVVFIVLARVLDPEAFGLLALAMVFLALMDTVVDMGFGDALVQRPQLAREELDTAFWFNVVASIGFLGLLWGAAPLLAEVLREPRLVEILRWLGFAIPLSALGLTQHAILRRKLDFRSLAIRSLLGWVVGGAAGLALALDGAGVWSLVALELVRRLVQAAVLWLASDWRPGLAVRWSALRRLGRFGANVAGDKILGFANTKTIDLLINFFLGASALGLYSVAYTVLHALTAVTTHAIAQVALPVFSRLQHDHKRLRHLFYSATQFTAALALPIFAGLIVVAPDAIPTLLGDQWGEAVPLLQMLALLGVLHSGHYFNIPVMLAVGKAEWRLRLNALNVIGDLVAFFIGIRWGLQGVVAALVIRAYLFSPLPVLVVRHLIGLNLGIYFGRYVAPIGASLAMVVAVSASRWVLTGQVSLLALLILDILLGAAVYVGALWMLAPELIRNGLSSQSVHKGAA